jgi:hypothetical protein
LKDEIYPVTRGELTWLNRHLCRNAEGELQGTMAYAMQVLGVPEWPLRRGRKDDEHKESGSRFFGGRLLIPERVPPPYPRRRGRDGKGNISVWPVGKLKELKACLEAGDPKLVDEHGTWLPLTRYRAEFGKSECWVRYWASKPSKVSRRRMRDSVQAGVVQLLR